MSPIYTSVYSFIGKLGRNLSPTDIQAAIPELIAQQQAGIGSEYGNTKETVEVIDYAYTEAEPNCWLVFARWKILPA
jgi:hypothetical protein